MRRKSKLGRRLLLHVASHHTIVGVLATVGCSAIAILVTLPEARMWLTANLWFVPAVALIAIIPYMVSLLYRNVRRITLAGIFRTSSENKSNDELLRYRIQDLVIQGLTAQGFDFHGAEITARTTVSDLILIYTRLLAPDWPHEDLKSAVLDSRRRAFDYKYGSDRSFDEKELGRDRFGDWENFVRDYCSASEIPIRGNRVTLEVGLGTGQSYEDGSLFEDLYGSKNGVKYFTDVSQSALAIAKKRFSGSGRKFIACSAERLSNKIEERSVDLYVSFRTFSASLFDTRRAIVEAKRVLKPGGYLLISIPHLYLQADGSYETGLIQDVSKAVVTKKYRDEVVQRIRGYLEMFRFQSIRQDDQTPYEVLISARRGTES